MGPENLRQQKIAFCKIDISLDLLYQLSPPLKLRCEMLALYTMQSYFVSVFLLLQKLWTDNATRSQRVTGTAATPHVIVEISQDIGRLWSPAHIFLAKTAVSLALERGTSILRGTLNVSSTDTAP